MQAILQTIAQEYSRRYSDLTRVCFIFPNKRCRTYLKKYLGECGVKSDNLPRLYTISELVSDIANMKEAGKIQQIFTLYNCYLKILEKNPPKYSETEEKKEEKAIEFEAFKNWGETVIADFNTVDLYMSNVDEIFKNVKDFREISANFLTEEQKEVMKEYFGVDEIGDTGEFWKSFNDLSNLTNNQRQFVNLWQIMAPLYYSFNEALRESSRTNVYATTGQIYRKAAEDIEKNGNRHLPYKKVVAVGFNALTVAERIIFKNLMKVPGTPGYDDYIDFIWDATGPFLNDPAFSASKFVKANRKHFPEPSWLIPALEAQQQHTQPEIDIIAAPTNTSQTKIAGQILEQYKTPENKKYIIEAEVALVLPDESLLTSTLFSLPDGIGAINLTMGVSMIETSISAFMAMLRRVYSSSRNSRNGLIFYGKDLKLLFTHPYAYILFPGEEIESLLGYMRQYHKVSISLEEVGKMIPTALELLNFPPKKEADIDNDIFSYLDKIFGAFSERLEQDGSDNNEDLSQIIIYHGYVTELKENMVKFGINMGSIGCLNLIERMVATEKMGFEGEPLIGLQVMGTLETRALDFHHVIILSMNEGLMPRKVQSSTFIPESLRKAYGLPPARYSEEIFSYYFYRLLSRAQKVTLIYDGRIISGMRGGESRYIMQLKEFGDKSKIRQQAWQYHISNREIENIEIAKTEDVKALLEGYSQDRGENKKNLSPSSLNNYRQCSLKFFLRNVLNLNPDPERGDFLDPISTGNVMHGTMMDLYMPADKQMQYNVVPEMLTPDRLQYILDHPEETRQVIVRQINANFYDRKDDLNQSLESGVMEMLTEEILQLVNTLVEYDLELAKVAPIELIGCEIPYHFQETLEGGRRVNFNVKIDRLDRIMYNGEKRLRIVDYKSGKTKLLAKDLEEIFNGSEKGDHIFQLFVYAWVLDKNGVPDIEHVMTQIYNPQAFNGDNKTCFPEIGQFKDKKEITDFADYREEFSKKLEGMIESIFTNPSFTRCESSEPCMNCGFRSYCGR